MMRRLVVVAGIAASCALTLAAPAAADDASFLAYLDSHGYSYYSSPQRTPDAALYTGRLYCQYPDWARSSPNGNPQYGLILEAAEHELCPSMPPADDNSAGFFAYLDSHGYNYYSSPQRTPDAALYTGRFYCQYPDLTRNTPNDNPQYGLIREAAQLELCPHAQAAQ